MTKPNPIDPLVKEHISYDPATGELRWIKSCGLRRAGETAGIPMPDGYLRLHFGGHTYAAHRIAWFLHYGTEPAELLDHRNCIRDDNRIENLREATHQENCFNRSAKKDKLKGSVRVGDGKFAARIKVHGRTIQLGEFSSPEEAHAAYLRKAAEFHGEFARFE